VTPIYEVKVHEPADLLQHIGDRTQPLVLRGIAKSWPVVKTSLSNVSNGLEYINEFAQSMLVGMGTVEPECQGRLFYNKDFSGFNFSRTTCQFSDFLDLLCGANNMDLSDVHYMGSTNVDRLLPGFRNHNDLTAISGFSPLVSIWMSNQAKVAAHQDLPSNLAVCVTGKRKFTLFPPSMTENLYIGPIDLTPAGQPISLVDHNAPDFKQFPKYKDALKNAVVAELEPGDALFLPSLWWHSVESLEPINVLINYWWQEGRSALGSPIDSLMHSIANIRNLPVEQKEALKHLFNYYVFEQSDFEHIPENARGLLSEQDENAIRKLRSKLLNSLNQ
jgi:hypothetical protein